MRRAERTQNRRNEKFRQTVFRYNESLESPLSSRIWIKYGEDMKYITKLFLSGLVVLVGLLAAACPDRTSIRDIEANPSRYNNKEVVIAGTVRDSYGVNIPGTKIRGGTFKIDDGTGSIWVITQDAVPTKGAQVGVKGLITNAGNWNGRNYGLSVYEKDRRSTKR